MKEGGWDTEEDSGTNIKRIVETADSKKCQTEQLSKEKIAGETS